MTKQKLSEINLNVARLKLKEKYIFGQKINIFCSYFMHFPFNYKFNTAYVVNDYWSLVSSLHWIVQGKELVLLNNNSPELQRDMPA